VILSNYTANQELGQGFVCCRFSCKGRIAIIKDMANTKHTISCLILSAGVSGLILLLLLIVTLFFGRWYIKPLLPETLGRMIFPPLPTPVENGNWQIFTPPELPETPPSILRAARQWSDDRDWEFGFCERRTSVSQLPHVSDTSMRVYDDPDYMTCLRHVRARTIDHSSENVIPGQWLPGRRWGDQARCDFEAILERRPDFFYAAYLLGCWYRHNGDLEVATRYFEQACATAPVVLVMSFDLFELPESWEQSRPPRVMLVNNRTFMHNIDLTYHYGLDDCAMVRYPLLRADKNGLVFIPAESDWLTWQRTYYTGKRNATAIDMPAVAQSNSQFDTAWRFRGLSKVALLQHVEMVTRPYDSNPMRTDPFFDPVWGTQQSLGVYERVAAYCEGEGEPSFLYDRRIVTQGDQYLPPGGRSGFILTESGTIQPTGGARLAWIDSRNPSLLTWFLQQTGMTRNALAAKMQTWYAEHAHDAEISLLQGMGQILIIVDGDCAAWLFKLVSVRPPSDSPDDMKPHYQVTTLRIGRMVIP